MEEWNRQSNIGESRIHWRIKHSRIHWSVPLQCWILQWILFVWFSNDSPILQCLILQCLILQCPNTPEIEGEFRKFDFLWNSLLFQTKKITKSIIFLDVHFSVFLYCHGSTDFNECVLIISDVNSIILAIFELVGWRLRGISDRGSGTPWEWINRDEKNLCAKGSLLKGFLEKSEHFWATCWNG